MKKWNRRRLLRSSCFFSFVLAGALWFPFRLRCFFLKCRERNANPANHLELAAADATAIADLFLKIFAFTAICRSWMRMSKLGAGRQCQTDIVAAAVTTKPANGNQRRKQCDPIFLLQMQFFVRMKLISNEKKIEDGLKELRAKRRAHTHTHVVTATLKPQLHRRQSIQLCVRVACTWCRAFV